MHRKTPFAFNFCLRLASATTLKPPDKTAREAEFFTG